MLSNCSFEKNIRRPRTFKYVPFLSNFNQDMNPFASSYCSPKYHVSRKPIVRQTKSNKSLPVDLHCRQNAYKVDFRLLLDSSAI